MLAFLANPLARALGGLVVAGLAVGGAYAYGKSIGRQGAAVEAARNALDRIEDMEKNNADFLALSDRERCLVFMRDSGLPEDHCAER
nr:hypothetical protein REQ54_01106 [Rhizobium sp. Q54]